MVWRRISRRWPGGNSWPILVIGGALVAVLLVLLVIGPLQASCSILVKLEPDSDAKRENHELFVSRSEQAPEIKDPEAFCQKLQKEGFRKRRFRAQMAVVSTHFTRVPAGVWYVHIRGTYEKGGMFRVFDRERSKRVELAGKQRATVTFELAATPAEYQLIIMNRATPVSGATVWLDDKPESPRTTDGNGSLLIDVPLGEHVIHVKLRSLHVSKSVSVTNTDVSYLTINLDREDKLANGIAFDVAPLAGGGEEMAIER